MKRNSPEATVRQYLTVQTEGTRTVKRTIEYYNLDMILAIGYRVRSHRGTQFRRCATAPDTIPWAGTAGNTSDCDGQIIPRPTGRRHRTAHFCQILFGIFQPYEGIPGTAWNRARGYTSASPAPVQGVPAPALFFSALLRAIAALLLSSGLQYQAS